MNNKNEYTLIAGSTVKVNGIPVELKENTVVISGTSLEKLNETRKLILPRKNKN